MALPDMLNCITIQTDSIMDIRLFFIDEHASSKQNGIGTYRDLLIPSLAARGVWVGLISLNSDNAFFDVAQRSYGCEYSVPTIAGGDWRGNGELIMPILAQYIDDRPDNIFLMNHSPSAHFIGTLRRQFPRSKVAFVVHDQGWCSYLRGDRALLEGILLDGGSHSPLGEFLRGCISGERDIYSLSDKVVALSPSAYSVLGALYGVPKSKLAYIANGYGSHCVRKEDRNSTREKLGLRPDEKLLVYSARPTRHKGVEAALKAMAKLNSRHPGVRCVMACSMGGLSEFDRLVSAAAPSLIVTGLLDRERLFDWYAAADIGLITSYTEQCSFSAMEMMDCGLTIVSSNGYGLSDMFAGGKNAFVADVGNVLDDGKYIENIVLAIERALSALPTELDVMKTENRRLLDTTYSLDAMAEGYLKLFSEMLEK